MCPKSYRKLEDLDYSDDLNDIVLLSGSLFTR